MSRGIPGLISRPASVDTDFCAFALTARPLSQMPHPSTFTVLHFAEPIIAACLVQSKRVGLVQFRRSMACSRRTSTPMFTYEHVWNLAFFPAASASTCLP